MKKILKTLTVPCVITFSVAATTLSATATYNILEYNAQKVQAFHETETFEEDGTVYAGADKKEDSNTEDIEVRVAAYTSEPTSVASRNKSPEAEVSNIESLMAYSSVGNMAGVQIGDVPEDESILTYDSSIQNLKREAEVEQIGAVEANSVSVLGGGDDLEDNSVADEASASEDVEGYDGEKEVYFNDSGSELVIAVDEHKSEPEKAEVLSQSGTTALLAIENEDPNYVGSVVQVSEEDRYILEHLVMGEAGNQGYEGAALVAQSIRDAIVYLGYSSVESVRIGSRYDGKLNIEPNQDVLNAVSYIFDQGGNAINHRVLYFYAPRVVSSDFHESQTFLIEYKGHRFFDRVY